MLQAAKPKRAAWDTKGQLDDLRSEVAEMKAMYRQTLDDKENQKQQIVEQKTQEISSVESRLTSQVGARLLSRNHMSGKFLRTDISMDCCLFLEILSQISTIDMFNAVLSCVPQTLSHIVFRIFKR